MYNVIPEVMKVNADFKIRIFQPAVPEYRVALFDGIAKQFPGCLEVWSANGSGGHLSSAPLKIARYDYSHEFVRFGPIEWQRGLTSKGMKKGDVLVVAADVHNLNTLITVVGAKIKGVRIVWWGHHKSSKSTDTSARVRFTIAKLLHVNSYLLYTKTGIDWMRNQGYDVTKVFATGNTIDRKPIDEAIKAWKGDRLLKWQADNSIANKSVLLFCSSLKERSRLEQVFRALASRELEKFNCLFVVIGDGPIRSKYEMLANELGVSDKIRWIGATVDQMVMAPWFLSAKLFVFPGPIGLSLQHAFAYGLPVVLNDCPEHNGPEYEALREGENGLTFKENDVNDLASVLSRALDDVDKLAGMGRSGRKLFEERYGIDCMVDNFYHAVEAARS